MAPHSENDHLNTVKEQVLTSTEITLQLLSELAPWSLAQHLRNTLDSRDIALDVLTGRSNVDYLSLDNPLRSIINNNVDFLTRCSINDTWEKDDCNNPQFDDFRDHDYSLVSTDNKENEPPKELSVDQIMKGIRSVTDSLRTAFSIEDRLSIYRGFAGITKDKSYDDLYTFIDMYLNGQGYEGDNPRTGPLSSISSERAHIKAMVENGEVKGDDVANPTTSTFVAIAFALSPLGAIKV